MSRIKAVWVQNQYVLAVMPRDLSGMVSEIEFEADSWNEEWQYCMGSDETCISIFERLLGSLDENKIESIGRIGLDESEDGIYWRLFEKYENEEAIIALIVENHLRIVDRGSDGILLEFYNPTRSPLYRFFRKNYRYEAVAADMDEIVDLVYEYMKKQVLEDPERYGEWEQLFYCEKCSCMYPDCDGDGTCPECGASFNGEDEEDEDEEESDGDGDDIDEVAS